MLAILVNPLAGRARRDPGLVARLTAIARGHSLHTTDTGSLPGLCDALAARGVSLIALCGGDGTGQATLTELVRAYATAGRALPRVALIGGGTVNTVTHNLGISGTPEEVLARLVRAVERGAALPTVRQSLLSVNGRRGFLFAAALGARFLELYYEAPEPGPARAVVLAVRVATSAAIGGALSRRLFRPAIGTLTIDGAPPLRIAARLLVASTVADVGIGMRICPRATSSDERFALIASALPPSAMARQLPAVLAGHPLAGAPEEHVDRLTTRVELAFEEDEPYTLDGDLFRARAITIEHAGTLSIVRA